VGLPGLQVLGNAGRWRNSPSVGALSESPPIPTDSPPAKSASEAVGLSPSGSGGKGAAPLLALPAPLVTSADQGLGHKAETEDSVGANTASSADGAGVDAAMSGPRVNLAELDEMEKAAKAASEAKKEHQKAAKAASAGDGSSVGASTSAKKRPAASAGVEVGVRPSFKTEWSRNQIVCDSGVAGPGRYHTISFKKHGGYDNAKKVATKWLAEQTGES